MHKILAMVAIAIVSTLTTGSATASSAAHHIRTVPHIARFTHHRQGEASPLVISAVEIPGTAASVLSRPGSFRWTQHPWHNLVRRPRVDARRARAAAAAAAAASSPLPAGGAGTAAAAHLSATGFEGCVMAAESGGVPTAWYPGHTDGTLPPPDSPVAEGLFGFLLTTWRGLGLGWPQGASFAPVKTQIKGFWKLYDAQGTAPWNGDGCAGGSVASTGASLMTFSYQALTTFRHHHRHHNHRRWLRWIRGKALAFALSQRGKPYVYGTDGPWSYDCSGLVMASYHHAGGPGRRLGRATYDMLAQLGGLLRQVAHPRRGDLAFFGSGHVELWLGWRHHIAWTFGALNSGTAVGRHRVWWGSWQPTMYAEVV